MVIALRKGITTEITEDTEETHWNSSLGTLECDFGNITLIKLFEKLFHCSPHDDFMKRFYRKKI